mmetsp:Transcript_11354/g.28776  ORF Transcript_11354/g.28776 Transcript_11354/m.28776 type:complete len:260 (-) Transcript_11354:593-1372(-)
MLLVHQLRRTALSGQISTQRQGRVLLLVLDGRRYGRAHPLVVFVEDLHHGFHLREQLSVGVQLLGELGQVHRGHRHEQGLHVVLDRRVERRDLLHFRLELRVHGDALLVPRPQLLLRQEVRHIGHGLVLLSLPLLALLHFGGVGGERPHAFVRLRLLELLQVARERVDALGPVLAVRDNALALEVIVQSADEGVVLVDVLLGRVDRLGLDLLLREEALANAEALRRHGQNGLALCQMVPELLLEGGKVAGRCTGRIIVK